MRSVRELMDLSGRVAVITGGAGGIGRVLAESLAEVGAGVVIVDIDAEAAGAVARGLKEGHGVAAAAYGVDLQDIDRLRNVPGMVVAEFGRLDILVNCAALVGESELQGWAVPLPQQAVGPWVAALAVNLIAPFVLTQAAADALRASGHGAVINIASIYGMVGPDPRLYEGTLTFNPAAYAASKGGLLQLTRWFATMLAPGVRVNAIVPGGVWRGHADPFLARYVERTPLRRMATEEDLKGAVVFLASDLAAYVTGQQLVVDGGWTAW